MLKWISGKEGESGSGGPDSPLRVSGAGEVPAEEMAERLSQTEQLVSQLKELIREKDAALRAKDDQLKMEKEACEAKLSKLRLQNKAKVTSLTSQLEELKKQNGGVDSPTRSKKGVSESGDQANRGKIVLLKKKVEDLEQQLAKSKEELLTKRKELESQWQRGEEMDKMLTEKDRKLSEKEVYIVHLQTALAGDQPAPLPMEAQDSGALQDVQTLVLNLTKKIGEAEERYSLLQEQTDSLKELLSSEKEQYSQKENMYKQNIQTFKDIILQKDNQLMEMNQMHEQELFKLAAKSDASADLEQLLKALKQKLHEKEEVLLGKTQVIDVFQGEVDARDEQIKELTERLKRLQVEQKSLESKMEAEKHVMRAQIRDLMEKQQSEVQRLTEEHQAELAQTQQDVLVQLEELRRAPVVASVTAHEEQAADSTSSQRIAKLEAKAKAKAEEASKSEAKFLKMKAWSKSRIRQLEDELKKSQAGAPPPELTLLRSQVTALEEERKENLWKVEQYEELKAKNEMLEGKLVVYEEQQRTLQADLEQFTKRAASQASESGSADDTQSQVLEWQEIVAEAVSARDRAREEKGALALRINHLEEEKEDLIEDDWFFPGCSDPALASRQQELEEELAQTRGLGPHRTKKLGPPAERSLQEDFEFDSHTPFQEPRSPSESTMQMEGENMGGWWPEYSSPDTDGLRSVVEELELERNQLQEQILSLEERCQDLEDRLQLQARIETLQNETEKLQSQLASVRSQQSREAEKHQLLVSSLNEQLKGLSDTQECLESSLIEKENTLAKTSEKLEIISNLQESLREKEMEYKELSDKLFQTEHTLEDVSKKCSTFEKQCCELKTEVADLTQKLSMLKEKAQKQEVAIETLQTELDQTNEELDKLNTAHLEERAQLIHDLQSCEREIDNLKDTLCEKEKEILTLLSNVIEYSEQITELKQEIKLKEENLFQVENALSKAEREAKVLRDLQSSDQQVLNGKISELVEKLKDCELELNKTKEERNLKGAEVEQLIKQADEDNKTLQDLRMDVQKQTVNYRNHLSECETHITSLKEQLSSSTHQLKEAEEVISQLKEEMQHKLKQKEHMYDNELKSFKDEQNILLAKVEKSNFEVQTLSKQLEEQAQSEEQVRLEMQEKHNIIKLLEKKMEEERTKYSSQLQERDLANQKISSELQSKAENVSKLKSLLKNLKTEKGQLHEKLKSSTEELKVEMENVKQLNEKVASVSALNNNLENKMQCLIEEKAKLEQQIIQHVSFISELTSEKDDLNAKITQINTMYSENSTTIEMLMKEKEDLTFRTNDLNRVLEQSTHSNSEILLAKTNECSHLGQLLREKEEEATRLQEKVANLSSTVTQLEEELVKKDCSVSDLRAKTKTLQKQQKQLQDALVVLEERERSLKSEAMQKHCVLEKKQTECESLQKEIADQKMIVSKLQTESVALKEECINLHSQIEAKEKLLQNLTEQNAKHKKEINDANNLVVSLGAQVTAVEENVRKLELEIECKQTELISSQSAIQSAMEENLNLRNSVESKEHNLANVEEQLKEVIEQHANLNMQLISLSDHNKRLQEELDHKMSELNTEKSFLQERYSDLEGQKLNNQKVIDGLIKENEELTVKVTELNKALKQNENLNSEKTNECSNLLREKEQCVQSLQEEVDKFKIEVSQLNLAINEKEQVFLEQKNQLLQLEDTVSMLQEQGSVLKSALMEKDAMLNQKTDRCDSYHKEVNQQTKLISQLQADIDSLQEECLGMKKDMKQKDQTLQPITNELQSLKDELKKRNESVLSLSNQLGAMNENAAEMETDLANLKATLEKLTLENAQLVREGEQKKAKMKDFEDSIQVLNEQNERLKTELLKTVTDLSKIQDEVESYKTAVNDKERQISALAEELNAEKERLNLTVCGNDDVLKQQKDLVHQLSSRITEREDELKRKTIENIDLVTKVSELEKTLGELRIHVDNLTTESSVLKATLENKEKASLEYENISYATVEKLNINLKAKEAECDSLKEQISHCEESISKLNSTLQVHISETETLKKTLGGKEVILSEQSKRIQDLQRKADEALLFKTQFTESTELVSQLQSECEGLRKSAEETQSAFSNLQEKYAAHLEELQDIRNQLSQEADEASILRKLLEDRISKHQDAQNTIDTLKSELSVIRQQLESAQELTSTLAKEKDEALASHQSNVSMLTVEIEGLKLQHLQVVAQMDALTENIEQREMALHAINSQYSAQAKQLVSQIQTIEEHNKKLQAEISLSKEDNLKQITFLNNENAHLQEKIRKLVEEKEDLEKRRRQNEETLIKMEQQSSSLNQTVERLVSEKESLQAKVSAKEAEISRLKENVEKLEQILQDSEKEWLLVLDKEKQDRNLITEQLLCVENEIKCKDVKVGALKEDLDHMQEKLSEAVLAVKQGSEQLRAKEMDALMSKSQLENVLASIQEKDNLYSYLQQTLDTVESQLQQLAIRNDSADKHTIAGSNDKCAYLLDMIKDLQQNYQSELEALKNSLNETVAKLKQTESVLNDGEKANLEKCQQIALLQESVNHLQAQLNTESEKVKEAAVKYSSLHGEVQAKEEYISCMNVQIIQQKQLLAGLSQQLKDRDTSIAQVMKSAANERVRLTEENGALQERVEKVENALKTSMEKCKNISQQFEMDIAQMTSQIDTKNLEICEICKRNNELKSEVAKLAKEKDAMKKKLQAALVVRKDLMKKLEHYESQNEENVSNKSQVSLLNDKLQEVQNQAQAAEKMYQENVTALKQKEDECLQYKAESELLMNENHILQATLNEKELWLADSIQNLKKKNSCIEQLQASLTEKENGFEREKSSWMLKIEELQNEMKTCQDEKESTSTASSASIVKLESELSQLKLDKAMLQKKAQAALLSRKETMKKAQESEEKLTQELAELKDNYKAFLEQQCQQTNELNAVQLNFEEKVRELEELHKTSLSYLDELDTLRQLLVERDKALQDLQMALAEKESQCHSLSKAQTELETVKSNVESTCLEMANKEQALITIKQKVEELEYKLAMVQNDLEKAQREVEVKTEDAQKYLENIKIIELQCEQEKQSSESAIEQRFKENEHKYHIIIKENKELLEKRDQLKMELETALALGSQKASDILKFEEMQLSLNEDKELMAKKLEEVNQDCAQMQRNFVLEKQQKENALDLVDKLKDEITLLNTQLNESQKQNVQLQERTAEMAHFEVKLTEKDDAMLEMQAHLLDKQELIVSLELQLEQQMKMHDIAIEKMKTEANKVQKSSEDATKMNSQESKIGLLTKKLQAALVSRKELQKDNATLKEELEKLSAKYEEKQVEFNVLESSVFKLKHQNLDLETSVATLTVEKHSLRAEVDSILNDNCSLSDACESLKQTIENITQQKQAFSCQLESLKDSQTEELSDWKLKHSELKQEYESLLQAYENVSSEMDKMRQHLEGAKRERQEAILKVHKHETKLENQDRQVREMERENEKLKESLQIFSQDKRLKIKELEAEGKKIVHLEAEVGRLLKMSEDLRKKVGEMEVENQQLVEKLKEANCSLEKKQLESNSHTENMQGKLDEALRLSNSLTVQIEVQKTELSAQLKICQLLQKEKQRLTEQIDKIESEHELELGKKDEAIQELNDIIIQHRQKTVSLSEKVRILEDDKSLLQEELENAQEISDKVKNENEYLETVILKNSAKIDELTESVSTLQSQKAHLSSQVKASNDMSNKIRQEKEEEQLKLVKEFEEKLKTVQRGNEGTKNVKKELQELLKEKHQEIILLQQNCIKYQEVILDLESSLKTSQSACKHSEKELKQRVERIALLEERSKQLESELITTQSLLDEAKQRDLNIQSERDKLALELSQHCQKRDKAKTLPIVKETHFFVENQVLQQQIEDLKMLNNGESQKVNELQQQIDSQDLQITTLKRAVETNEAKLTALTSSPQGADATKVWNDLYQKALHEKDNQLLEQGFVIKRFLEDMRTKDKEVNELHVTKSRLERTLNEYSVAATAHQRQLFVMSASNTELNETLEMLCEQVKELTAQVERIEQEKNMLNKQLADKDEVISQIQLKLQQSEKLYADSDAQMHSLQAQIDKLQTEFEKQEGISLQLKHILQSKNAEISSLLSCKDGQMSGYLEQLQANYRSQITVYEDRLTSARYQREKSNKELRSLEAKVKSLQIQVGKTIQEKDHMAAKMESFKNSLVSLQSERERLMSEYRILEAKRQLGLRAKEGSGDGEGGATKGLKHEIRKLLHQMDDLNSENAMLRAQLVRYREDLNQVLSLKDNQIKILLKRQQDAIKTLENNKIATEKQHRETCLELERVEETNGSLKSEISKLKAEITKLEDERVMTNEGRVIADLQNAVATKAAECNNLQQKLLFEKNLCNELKDKLQQLETETDTKLSEAEEKYNSELDNFEREVNVMRNERETADQRLAELAKDLLEVEQQLSEARTQSKDAKTQNDSLCKAMAALQNDRDQLIKDFKILQNRYDEELRETQAALTKMERKFQDTNSDLAMSAKQRDILVHKLKALETNDIQSELTKLVDELGKALSEKERELKNVALENDTYCRQISAFSRSMASLQNDRDRLIDELAGAKRVFEVKQGSSKEVATFMSVDRSQNSAFQLENKELEARQTLNDVEKDSGSSQDKMTALRSGQEMKDMHPVTSKKEETVSHLEKERIRLHQDLQRCLFEIHQRDQYIHQFNTKLQQAVEEKGTVAAQLRTVSQTLRDTQNRCNWLETQVQSQTQGAVYAEEAPGAPQERSSESVMLETTEAPQLRDRLLELEQSFAEERARREAAEEALRIAEDGAKSHISRENQRDFSIEMEAEDEWEALSLNPNQPLITRKVKGGMATCRRWLRGRSLYFSRLLTGRARSRYLFLAYLLTLHVLVFMCLTGSL